MAALSKLNGYTKFICTVIGTVIVILGIIVGWAVGATSMSKDIKANTNNITLLRQEYQADVKEIKTDIKILLQRK